jgi:hypothetical protein
VRGVRCFLIEGQSDGRPGDNLFAPDQQPTPFRDPEDALCASSGS